MKKLGRLLILLFGAGLALNSFAQTNSKPSTPTAGIVAASKKFLATLDDAQRGKVVFDFKDERAAQALVESSDNNLQTRRACAWAT